MILQSQFMVHVLRSQKPAAVAPSKAKAYAHAQMIVNSHLYTPCGHYVVCDGVHTVAQAVAAMKNQGVAELYSKLGPMHASVTDHGFFAYDSYRVGNKIYWTKRPRFIKAGEPILTDGRLAILMRCGNLISLQPEIPTLDVFEPDNLYPPVPETPTVVDASTPIQDFGPMIPASVVPDTTMHPSPVINDPIYYPGWVPLLMADSTQRVTPVPEPSTFAFLLVGFMSLIAAKIVRNHEN
jgi:hypothetical protein